MKNIVISAICGLFSAILFVSLNNYFNVRTIGVVKVDQVIADHLKQYSTKDMTDEKRMELSQAFAKELDAAILEVSESEKVTLLVAPAVVTSVPDYTTHVQKVIGSRLDGK